MSDDCRMNARTTAARTLRTCLLGVVLAGSSLTATAFSQAGHMVTGAVVYEELHAGQPAVLERLVDIMTQHPDRGAFEVALERTTGETRTRRLLMEMARWPDDVRKSSYDHPTWHYASKPLVDLRRPPRAMVPAGAAGSAVEAFFLNVSVARDPRAPAPERAMALCWILHLVGDIHQPLHAADQYSAESSTGDHGGNLKFIIDPQTQEPLTVHGYWDQAANRSSDAAPARATELMKKYPREIFRQLGQPGMQSDDFNAWAAESYALARSEAYRDDLTAGADEAHATPLTAAYRANAAVVAERQLVLAGYRLTDLLTVLLR
jgi:hypothetical protein